MLIRSTHIKLFISKEEESVNDVSACKKGYVLGLHLQLKHQIYKEPIHLTVINKALQQGNFLVNKQLDVSVPH
jgi:hypothetical protein